MIEDLKLNYVLNRFRLASELGDEVLYNPQKFSDDRKQLTVLEQSQ
jgi:hypothetical protein